MTMSESSSSSPSSSSSSSDGEDSSTSSSRSSSSSSSSGSSSSEDDNSSQIMNGTKINSSQSRQSNAMSPSLSAAKQSNINNIHQQYKDSLQLLSTLIKSKASRPTEVSWRSITTRGSVQHDSQEEFDELCHRFINDNEDHWDLPLWKLAQVVQGRLRDEADNHYKNMNESLESSSSSSNSNSSSSSSNSSSSEEVSDDAHQNENEYSTNQIDLAKHSSDENSSASSEVETIGESSYSDESGNSNDEQRDSSPLGMEIDTQDSESVNEDATGKDVFTSSTIDVRLNDKDQGEDDDIDGSSTSSSSSTSSESTKEEKVEGGDNHFDSSENSSIQSEGDASQKSKSIEDNDDKSKRSGATLHKTLSSHNGKARTTIAATEQSKMDNELDTEINQSSSSSSPSSSSSSSSDNSTSSSSSSSSSEGGEEEEDNQHHDKDEDNFEFNGSQDIFLSDDKDFLQTNKAVDTKTHSKLSTPDNHAITTTVEKNISATKEKGTTDKSEFFQSSLPSRASPRRSRAKRKLFQEVEENCSPSPSKSASANSGSNKRPRKDVEHYEGGYFSSKSEAYSKAAARPRRKAAYVPAASISVGGKSQNKVGESGEEDEGAEDTKHNIEAFSKEVAVVRPRRKAAVVAAVSVSTGRNIQNKAKESEGGEDESADISINAKAKEATGRSRRIAASLALDSISTSSNKQTKARVSKSKDAQEKSGNDTINPPSPKKATAKPRKRKVSTTKSTTGKRNRSQCTVESCTNQARSKGLCQRHGAKVTMCSYEGCPNQAIRNGICIRHGAKPPPKKKGDRLRCVVEDCQNYAKKGGVCIRHGAVQTRARCKYQGCTKQAQKGGHCVKHGAEVFCNEVIGGTSQEGELCPSPEVCIPVAATKRVRNYTRCSVGDCEKYAQQGGLCIEHGAEVTKCRVEGCKSNAKKLGLCKLHGAYRET